MGQPSRLSLWYGVKRTSFDAWRRQFKYSTKTEIVGDLWTTALCRVLGHKKPYQRKFGGELLCRRCSLVVGRWR
jgi:hypothetical protein